MDGITLSYMFSQLAYNFFVIFAMKKKIGFLLISTAVAFICVPFACTFTILNIQYVNAKWLWALLFLYFTVPLFFVALLIYFLVGLIIEKPQQESK